MSTLITLQEVDLAFGHHPLLQKASLIIENNERIGLIGRNGAGKSSLLKVLQGELAPDGGQVHTAGGLRVAKGAQEPDPQGDTIANALAFAAASGSQPRETWECEMLAGQWAQRLKLDPD